MAYFIQFYTGISTQTYKRCLLTNKILQPNKYRKSTYNRDPKNKFSMHVSSDLYEFCSSQNPFKKGKEAKAKQLPYQYEFVYGVYPVLLALQAGRRTPVKLFYKEESLRQNEKVKDICNICQNLEVPTVQADKSVFIKLLGREKVHQGVCLEASKLSFLSFEDHIKSEEFMDEIKCYKNLKLWLYLDQIHDPMNLGAILRTSYYLGVQKIFTSGKNSCPLTNVVSKASAGVSEAFPVYEVENINLFLNMLQKHSWDIVCSSASYRESSSLEEYIPTKSLLLIIGNEGRGVSQVLEDASDTVITVPTLTEHKNYAVQALNVSAATAILLYSLQMKLRGCSHIG